MDGNFMRDVIMDHVMVDMKGLDTDLSLVNIDSDVTTNKGMFIVNLIRRGVNSWERIGRTIRMYSLRVKGHILLEIAGGAIVTEYDSVRMLVVLDRQCSNDSVIPAWDTVFGRTNQAGVETSLASSLLKYDNINRYVVLEDLEFTPNPGATTFVVTGSGSMTGTGSDTGGGGDIDPDAVSTILPNAMTMSMSGTSEVHTTSSITLFYEPVDFSVDLRDIQSSYSGTAVPMTIDELATGALYVMMKTVSGVSIDAFDMTARLMYTD